jgi:hypothetical protein
VDAPFIFYVFSDSPLFSFTSGLTQLETFPQLLHVGETEQLALTLLLTQRYATEAEIPPRIKNRPLVLKNSFLFISFVLFRFSVHVSPVFQAAKVDAPFLFLFIHPPFKSSGYIYLTPLPFFVQYAPYSLGVSTNFNVPGVCKFECRS